LKKQINSNIKIKVSKIIDKAVIGIIEESKISTFLHWKEISYNEKIENLKNIKKGDILTVRLKEVDGTKVKVSLREANEKDPWDYLKSKKVGDIITTRVIEVLKTGAIKVAADPDKKIITTIKKSDLAIETADQRAEVFSKGNKLDAKLVELSLKTRTIKLSVRAAEEDAQKSLIRKFGENAAKSGGTLKDILSSALGGKKKKKEEK